MNAMNALGVFMDYCNRNMGMDERVTQSSFQQGMNEIMSSSDDRFAYCRSAEDILRVLGWR